MTVALFEESPQIRSLVGLLIIGILLVVQLPVLRVVSIATTSAFCRAGRRVSRAEQEASGRTDDF